MKKHYSYPILLLLILSVISCSGPKDNATLLAESESLIQKNEISEAVINLKNILQKDPNHSQARFLLGSAYLSVDNYQSAEKEFQRSLSVNPENNQALLMLAKTQINLNQFENVIKSLNDQDFTDTEDKIYALLLLGQAYLSLDKIDFAKDKFQKASTLNSDSLHSIFGAAILAAYENRAEEALNLASRLLKKENNYTQAWLLKGSIHSKQKKYFLAAEAYSSYYKLKPHNIGIRTLVAHNYIRSGEYDLAKPHIDDLRKINENHPTINTLAAQLKYSEQNYKIAKELADSVVNATNNGLAQMISGLSSFQLKNYEQAYYQLSAIADQLPNGHQVNKILAILQIKLGYTEELKETLGKFSELTSDDAAVYANIGMEFVNQGDKKSALNMLNKASLLAPKDEKIQAHLGIFKLLNSDKSGVANLEEAIEINPNFKAANIALAMNYLKSGEINKAKTIATQWITNNPMNTSALILRGSISLKAGETDDAISYFKKARKIDATNLISTFNLAVIASEQESYDKSNNYLDEIFSIDLEYPLAYRLAISNSLKLNKQNELKVKLQSIIESTPEAIWPRIILARKLVVEKNYQQAIALLEYSKNYENLPTPYLLTLSSALLSSKQNEKLSLMYTQWQHEQPANETAYLNYIDILDKRKDYKNALEAVKKGLSQEELEDDFQLLSLEPYYLLATQQVELASKKVKVLANSNPDNAFILRIEGQISLSQENYSAAVKYLSRSYELNNKVPVGLFLVAAYKKNHESQKAIDFLNIELKKSPNIDVYKKSLAELYISNSPNKAVNNYLQLLEKHPNDIVILNNLAWTYYQENNLESAYIYAAKAKVLAPKHPKILDTFGIVLTKQNKLDQAITALELAYSLAPSDIEIKAHLASAYAASNQQEKADKLLEGNNTKMK